MKNKKALMGIVAAIAVIVIIIIVLVCGGTKYTEAEVNQATWLEAGNSLKVVDGDHKIVVTPTSDLNLDKEQENYEYTVNYTIKVDDTEYTATTTFYPNYSVRSESKDSPYSVILTNFENGKVEVMVKPIQ